MKRITIFVALLCCACLFVQAQRTESLLEKGWKFIKADVPGAQNPNFNDSRWQQVTIPHDWAIYGPFDRDYDLQEVTVTQNMEKKA
ncbi:MAG: beta-galactosidase, partial [Bacteroidaceae bacterium]